MSDCPIRGASIYSAPQRQVPGDGSVGDARTCSRRAIAVNVKLRRCGAASYIVRTYDLSQTGCKLEFIERPRVDEIVWLKFEGLDILRAIVRWTGDFTAGLEFERPIYTPVLDRLVGRSTRVHH